MTSDDYVLGTHDDEIARLEFQHAVWRERALEAWQRAGIAPGHTVIDLGCGPGFAALDLADRVGPTGRVIALDRSQRFLDSLARRADRLPIEPRACELDVDELPARDADAAWARWVFCFVERPRELITRVARALRPGGVFVAHEYFDYATWRAAPRDPDIESFVAEVMASWRAHHGEPDIALDLVGWLADAGFELTSVRPIVDVVPPSSQRWIWMRRFGEVGLQRLVELGRVTPARAAEIAGAWTRCEARAGIHMVTPGVLEIVAVRR